MAKKYSTSQPTYLTHQTFPIPANPTLSFKKNKKVWIQPPTNPPQSPASHPFTGFYIQYPDPDLPPTLGLVSSVSDDPPTLNWIYIDRSTRQLRYGNRTQSRDHIVGPWGWDAGEDGGAGGLTMGEGEEGVVNWVQGGEGGWQVLWEGEGGGVEEIGRAHV